MSTTWTKLSLLLPVLALAGCITASGSREANTCAASIMEMSGSSDIKGQGRAIVVSFLDENFSAEELDALQTLFSDKEFKSAYLRLLQQGDSISTEVIGFRIEELHCQDVIKKLVDCLPQLDGRFNEEIEAEIGFIKERDDNALQEIETLLDLQRSDNETNSY